jgi:hypothetical protein
LRSRRVGSEVLRAGVVVLGWCRTRLGSRQGARPDPTGHTGALERVAVEVGGRCPDPRCKSPSSREKAAAEVGGM